MSKLTTMSFTIVFGYLRNFCAMCKETVSKKNITFILISKKSASNAVTVHSI